MGILMGRSLGRGSTSDSTQIGETRVNAHPIRQHLRIENDSTVVVGQSAAEALGFATEPGLLVTGPGPWRR